MAHGAVTVQAHPRHEFLRGSGVERHFVDPVEQAVAITETHVAVRDSLKRLHARRIVWLGPCGEPRISHFAGVGVQLVGNEIGKYGQLIPPSLDVLIACSGIAQLVDQCEPRARGFARQRDGNERGAGRHRLT